MSENQRGYAWLDESIEHSEQDEARATALARRWSDLHNEEEQRRWAREADVEDGRCYEPDLDECEVCGGTGTSACSIEDDYEPEKCSNPECEDGWVVTPLREYETRQREKEAERQLEIEIVEEKLERMGARMMHPYEHWNEDERYMEYQERDRD